MNKKKKKNAITIMLLLLVLIISGIGYGMLKAHNNRVEKEKAEKEAKDNSVMLNDFEADSIANLTVTSKDENFVFVKVGDTWILQGEEDYPLSQSKLTSMVSGIAKLSATRMVVENPEDLSEYGLDQPSILIKAVTTEGKEYSLQIGDKLPTDTDYFGTTTDHTVYVIPMTTRTKYAVTKNELFDVESSPSITADNIREVKVTSQAFGDFHMEYDGNNPADYSGMETYPWYMKDGYVNPINMDNTRTSDVLSNYTVFTFSKGIDYKTENQKNYGLVNPSAKIFVRYLSTEGEEKTYTLLIGDTDSDGNYYVSPEGSNRTYLMLKDAVDKKIIIEDKDSLLSKFTQMINILNVEKVMVSASGENKVYEIKRTDSTDSDGKTSTTETFFVDGTEADATEFRSIYQQMIGLKMVEPLKEVVTVVGNSVLTLTFLKTDGNELVVEYHPYDAKRYTVTVDGKTSVLADKSEIDNFVKTILSN
jgi:hypothetical protein